MANLWSTSCSGFWLSSQFVNKLSLITSKPPLPIEGIGSITGILKSSVNLEMQCRTETFTSRIEASVLLQRNCTTFFKRARCEQFNISRYWIFQASKTDMLIGAELYWSNFGRSTNLRTRKGVWTPQKEDVKIISCKIHNDINLFVFLFFLIPNCSLWITRDVNTSFFFLKNDFKRFKDSY